MRTLFRSAACALALAATTPALAADRAATERLRGVEDDLQVMDGALLTLKANYTERSGLLGVADARQRYEDGLYAYLVGDYASAALTLYVLVQSKALGNDTLEADAEWYLAECIHELENYHTALEAYDAILQTPGHIYAPDALRRSLETFALLGDTARFDAFYQQYIASGKFPTTDAVAYTLGKSYHRRNELTRAKSSLEGIPATSTYYGRARYFLGVMMLAEGNLDQAIVEFGKVDKLPADDPTAQAVREQAILALGRLYYEKGDFTQAVSYYTRIGDGSPHLAESLYESLWAFIKAGYLDDARKQAEAFLLGYPMDRHTAEVELLVGHLHLKSGAYDDAVKAYDLVSESYTPVTATLDGVVASPDRVKGFLDNLGSGQGTSGLPGFAVQMLLDDDRQHRAAQAYTSLIEARRDLAQSADLAQQIESTLAKSGGRLASFDASKVQADGIRHSVLGAATRLIDVETAVLKAGGGDRAGIAAVLDERDRLVNRTMGGEVTDDVHEQVIVGLRGLHDRLLTQRSAAANADPAMLRRVDEAWGKVATIDRVGLEVQTVVQNASARETANVRDRLATTKARLGELDAAIATASGDTTRVAVGILTVGLHDLHDELMREVVDADKGIVDSYWIRKVGMGEAAQEMTEDEAVRLQQLSERFDRLKEGFGP